MHVRKFQTCEQLREEKTQQRFFYRRDRYIQRFIVSADIQIILIYGVIVIMR